MDMKEYMAPEMEVIELKMQASLMVISGNDDDDDDPMSGGGGLDPSTPGR